MITIAVWYFGSWVCVKAKLIKQESATLFNKRVFLIQLGFLPAFFGLHILDAVGRVTDASLAAVNRLDIVFTGVAVVVLTIWFFCSLKIVKKGLPKVEAIILLNAAAMLALALFLRSYLSVSDFNNLYWTIGLNGRVSTALDSRVWGSIGWQTVDPMLFYEQLTRVFIRLAPNMTVGNLKLYILLSFGLLIVLSIVGTILGTQSRSRRRTILLTIISLLLVALFFITCAVAITDNSEININERLFEHGLSLNIRSSERYINFGDVAGFEWSYVYIFMPGMARDTIESIIGFEDSNIPKVIEDGYTQMLFVCGRLGNLRVVCNIHDLKPYRVYVDWIEGMEYLRFESTTVVSRLERAPDGTIAISLQ